MVSRLFNKLLTNPYFISFHNHNIINKKVGFKFIPSLTAFHNKSICNSMMVRKLLINAANYQFSSSKLSQKQIESSSYQELVDKLAKLYNFQQYRIPSALALLQIHHHYNIFKPGNWVLDIGAGPNWSWTQLALKLTHTPNMLERVISCDIKHIERKQHPNNIIVTGDFLEQPVRTKIALNLLNRQLDIILIDATKDYTGDQQIDAYQTLQVYIEALKFSQKYLKKGGTIILKTVQSSLSLKNQNQSKFFFNQVYRYKSSAFRINSPAFFYVLKGYMMNDNLSGLQKFYNQYNKAKSTYAKVKIVEEYRSKYKWDPVEMVINAAKQRVAELKGQGRKNKEIAAMYENDPFVKIGQILSLMQKIEDKKANPIQKAEARRELVLGKQQGLTQLPRSKEQFAEYLFAEAEKSEKEHEEQLKKKKLKSSGKRGKNIQTKQKIQQKAPLSDNQIYLKSTKVVESPSSIHEQKERTYFEQDLYGFNQLDPSRSIHLKVVKSQQQQRLQDEADLQKILKSFPEVRQAFERNKQQNSEQYRNFEEMFSEKQKKNETKAGNKGQKIKKQQIRNQFKDVDDDEDEDEQQDLQSQFPSTKSEQKVKNRIRNTRKAGESSEFDFDDSEALEKQERAEYSRMERQQFVKDSKIQYLKSKPKKSRADINQKQKKSGQPSYFKMRDKNKRKDIF